MTQFIRDALTKGRSFVIVEQNISLLKDIASFIIGLERGQTVFKVPASSVSREELIDLLRI